MGKYAACIEEYLQDKERFADLFNGGLFQGEQIILPGELLPASEKYAEHEEGKSLGKRRRERDVKMYLSCGTQLRILAVEAQKYVDYSMPVRCINYDAQEYMRQLRELQQKNSRLIFEKKIMPTTAERLCRVMKTDRLHPVYTVCLYYGREPWDAPRDLFHMMNFGTQKKNGKENLLFRDYPLWLVCVNEQKKLEHFHTDIREVFRILNCRGSKRKMQKLLQDKTFGSLTEETWEVVATLTDWPALLEKGNSGEKQKRKEIATIWTAHGRKYWQMNELRGEKREGKKEENREEKKAEKKAESQLYRI